MSALATTVLAPLAATAAILLLRRTPAMLALAGTAIGLAASLALLAGTFGGEHTVLTLPGLPGLPLRLLAEPLTAVLSVLVAGVGACVMIYAVGYMKDDPEPVRFFATMTFFLAAMQALVLAGDWLLLLAAWELIGLSSYLLIGFWYRRPGVPAAASRAFLYTRSADLGLYLAVFVLIGTHGGSVIDTSLAGGGPAALAVGLGLLAAAIGKSAQVPLQDWLQRAMAGPTPVSALLHSATLVAAGAILLIRSAPLLPPGALLATGLVGGVTTLITGLVALGEGDLKRLLAASTSSQYGLMLVAVGAGVPLAALAHLLAHATIKSSLFLGAGVFQHARGSTALDALHGAGREHRTVFAGFTLAALALAGIPPLSGFFSKDAVIAAALGSPYAPLLGPLALAGTLLTGAYLARALRILWRGDNRPRPLPGLAWMGTGFTILVALAAALGLAFPALEAAFPVGRLPETAGAQAAGLAAALAGLAAGWWIGGRRLLGPLLGWARRDFAVAGGLDRWILRPALVLAAACERLERKLYHAVLAIGRLGLRVAAAIRLGDERGIDALIFALVRGTVGLGRRLRALQSGLVHRELAITAAGTALLWIALLASAWP